MSIQYDRLLMLLTRIFTCLFGRDRFAGLREESPLGKFARKSSDVALMARGHHRQTHTLYTVRTLVACEQDEVGTTKDNLSARCEYNVTGWVSMWAYDMLSV